jgi:hypothetical protein
MVRVLSGVYVTSLPDETCASVPTRTAVLRRSPDGHIRLAPASRSGLGSSGLAEAPDSPADPRPRNEQKHREMEGYELSWPPWGSEIVRRAWRSPQAKANARPAASNESRLPTDRIAARLATVSRRSLANVAFVHVRAPAASCDRAATTVPRPRTRSRIPIVLIKRRAGPVGVPLPVRRNGAPGPTINAIPTVVRSTPIDLALIDSTSLSVASLFEAYPRRRDEMRRDDEIPRHVVPMPKPEHLKVSLDSFR